MGWLSRRATPAWWGAQGLGKIKAHRDVAMGSALQSGEQATEAVANEVGVAFDAIVFADDDGGLGQ